MKKITASRLKRRLFFSRAKAVIGNDCLDVFKNKRKMNGKIAGKSRYLRRDESENV